MGLISNALPGTTLKPFNPASQFSQAKSFGYDPALGAVNLATDSVSGQLDAILGEKNTGTANLIQRARTNAAGDVTQGMNTRGLINSSMNLTGGIEAAEDAAYRVAVPIATQDANTFSTQRLTNQQANNTADQFGAGAASQAGIVNAGAANTIAQQKLAGEQQLGTIAATGEQQRATQATGAAQAQTLQAQQIEAQKQLSTQQAGQVSQQAAAQASFDQALQTLRGTQASGLAEIEAGYRTAIQTSDSASKLFTAITNAITVSQSDVNTTAEQKAASVAQLTAMLKNGLAVISGAGGGTIDLTSLLTFNSVQQPISTGVSIPKIPSPQQFISAD